MGRAVHHGSIAVLARRLLLTLVGETAIVRERAMTLGTAVPAIVAVAAPSAASASAVTAATASSASAPAPSPASSAPPASSAAAVIASWLVHTFQFLPSLLPMPRNKMRGVGWAVHVACAGRPKKRTKPDRSTDSIDSTRLSKSHGRRGFQSVSMQPLIHAKRDLQNYMYRYCRSKHMYSQVLHQVHILIL